MAKIALCNAAERTTVKKLLALAILTALTGLVNTAKAEEVPPILDSVTGAQHQGTMIVLNEASLDEVRGGFSIPLSPVVHGRRLVWDSKVFQDRLGAVLFAPLGGNTPAY